MKGFDPLVPFYDILASVVFLGEINRSQKFLCSAIDRNAKVLILGGGTGKILENLDPSISITFVELSQKMISRARKRKAKATVDFVQCDFLKWESNEKFDYVLCPFFLDLFNEYELGVILDKLKFLLKLDGKLLVVDFEGRSTSTFHQILLRFMFLFFSITGSIKVKKYNNLFEKLGFNFKENELRQFFYNGFIRTSFYSNNSQ